MIFKRTNIINSLGCVLAHSINTSNGKLKKGSILKKEDIKILSDSKITDILVGVIEKDDITENIAANRIASAIKGKNIYKKQPFTGRSNLFSNHNGVLEISEKMINKINYIDESITIATLPNWSLVKNKQMIATIKIIPFVTKEKYLTKIKDIITSDDKKMKVHKLKKNKVGIIYTQLFSYRNKSLDKTKKVVNNRLISLGSLVKKEIFTEHSEKSIALSITELIDNNCNPILIYGASAIIDRKDVVPMAIKICGGKVEHFGMPVDPGNLILLGKKNNTKIIGIPSCAKSPKLNGFDWILWRILSGLDINTKDIQKLGVGGLLKEIYSRPQPREREK
ncbi:MAG: hypothetical protein CFH01_00342 [Alphaproteobacteria bacterium MarineAlpha2_Bin1]|nr:MAG: hypothetical protein CFH01_00342 [Alphaproteobacteria bacterium MarineAlpha2_Bin1]|tara:strand:+ start:475 stop:1485 length:1011 start_codon:yes stop_codon:yes gene_type:complete